MSIFSRVAAVFSRQREEVRPQNVTYADSVMEAFGVTPGAAGISVSALSAQRVAAVSACRQKIAGSISTLRLDVLQIDGDTEVKLPRDALWYLLNEAPHTQFTATSHWENKVSEQLLRGDGFTWIRRRMNGSIAELFPLPWSCVQPWRMPDGSIRYYINLPEWGIKTWLEPADVLHFPGSGFDGLSSMSVIAYGAKNAIGNALAMDEYSGKFFANGAHPSIILSTDKVMNEGQKIDLRTAFAAKHSGIDNAHRLPLVLTEGLKATEISLTAEDAQLIEARKFQVVDIARAFGVPPHMIGETSGSSAVGAGYEQQARDFVMHTLRLHLKRLEQELNRKLFPRDTGKFVRFDLSELIEGDSKAQADYNRAALGGPGTGQGWMKVNEVRKKIGLPPVENGDAIFDPTVVAAPPPPPSKDAENVAAALREMQIANEINAARRDVTPPQPSTVNVAAPVVNVTVPEQPASVINVAAPVVNVTMPEQPPSVVNVAAPVITVDNHMASAEPPTVNVAVPETVVNVEAVMPAQEAPVVHVHNEVQPAEVNVSLPDRKITGTVERNAKGEIVKTTQIETDL